MPRHKLLRQLPHFKETVQSHTAGLEPTTSSLHLTAPELGPPLMDYPNPAVKMVIKGREVHGSIIDGGSGVNVISEATCHELGITQWEPCSFCLRMADTRSVRPIGLISNLDFILRAHTFNVSTVVLQLDAPRVYPLLLGRPWVRTTNIKQHWQHNMISFHRRMNHDAP